jgi:tRNA dimethylallyltransferase
LKNILFYLLLLHFASQLFRGLDIGSAKVTVEEQDGVAHHLVDVVPTHETFSVIQFQQAANAAVRCLVQNSKSSPFPDIC